MTAVASEIAIGADCRVFGPTGPPARYVGHGWAMYVSCQDNSIHVAPASLRVAPNNLNLPVPSDDEVYAAAAAVRALYTRKAVA